MKKQLMFRGMELNEMTQIQMEGYQAFYNAAWRHNNPYPEDTQEAKDWYTGFDMANTSPSRD